MCIVSFCFTHKVKVHRNYITFQVYYLTFDVYVNHGDHVECSTMLWMYLYFYTVHSFICITGRSCRLFIRSLSSKIKPCKWFATRRFEQVLMLVFLFLCSFYTYIFCTHILCMYMKKRRIRVKHIQQPLHYLILCVFT